MNNENILIFLNGYIGEGVLKLLKKYKIYPLIATANQSLLKRTTLSSISLYNNDYKIHEIPMNYYEESSEVLPEVDFIICIDWKKDYFTNKKPKCPVYYIHPSLLPKYRGYGAVSEQFLRGVVYSGISVYEYNGIIDGGDIIYQKEIKIENYYFVADFMDIVAKESVEFIKMVYSNKIFEKRKQDESLSFYLPKIRKNSKKIDFNASAFAVYNFIRAYTYPFSNAIFYYKGEEYRVCDAILESWSGMEGRPGEIVSQNDYGLIVACGDGSILIKEIDYKGQKCKALMMNVFEGEVLE